MATDTPTLQIFLTVKPVHMLVRSRLAHGRICSLDMPLPFHMPDHGGLQVLETSLIPSMPATRTRYVRQGFPTQCEECGCRAGVRMHDLLEGAR